MLRIYAKPGNVLYIPGTKQQGAPPRYYGRTSKPVRDKSGTVIELANRATREPMELDENDPRHAALVKRLVDRCRGDVNTPDGAPVWAADKETAKALGIPYVDVAYDDDAGEWLPTLPAAERSSKPKKSDKADFAPKGAEL